MCPWTGELSKDQTKLRAREVAEAYILQVVWLTRRLRMEELAKLKMRGRRNQKCGASTPLQELDEIGDMLNYNALCQPQPNGSRVSKKKKSEAGCAAEPSASGRVLQMRKAADYLDSWAANWRCRSSMSSCAIIIRHALVAVSRYSCRRRRPVETQ